MHTFHLFETSNASKNKIRIPFGEPVSPRYIHINPATNQVHLLVPIVSGQEISTDNTCRAHVALRTFFNDKALSELTAYKNALEMDIALLDASNPQRAEKEARLVQIAIYIHAVSAMQKRYDNAITTFLQKPSNLYGIQLRPREQDPYSIVVNPAFHIKRENDAEGTPLSALYNAMHKTLPNITMLLHDPHTQLTNIVLKNLPVPPRFEDIQHVLEEQCLATFGVNIDFTRYTDGTVVSKAAIDDLMGFSEIAPATLQDYIYVLLSACAPNIGESIPTPPFYSIPGITPPDERTERLSILTQFFLANVNIYCKSRGISTQNFGVILDASPDLSQALVDVVATTLTSGDNVERNVLAFINQHQIDFGLNRLLNLDDSNAIRKKFESTSRTVIATKGNPHMDDFMILDLEATGETAQCVIHQGAICVDFAEIVDAQAAASSADYFMRIRADFATHPAEIPHQNASIAGELDLDVETLFTKINDEQFEQLPKATQDTCKKHPSCQNHCFLNDVAKGKQDAVEALLSGMTADNAQRLLQMPGTFTDYSGRTFHCTAYEYAYWAKDSHMCHMLASYMDINTRTLMLERIDTMERTDTATGQAVGLVYQQHGKEHHSAHFDLTPLKTALQHYVNHLDNWFINKDKAMMRTAWLDVGKAQRDAPAHVAQAYCYPGDSFEPTPLFSGMGVMPLQRNLVFYNQETGHQDTWFPLSTSITSGLGLDFAFIRTKKLELWNGQFMFYFWQNRGHNQTKEIFRDPIAANLMTLSRLDEMRTLELTMLRDRLTQPASIPDIRKIR